MLIERIRLLTRREFENYQTLFPVVKINWLLQPSIISSQYYVNYRGVCTFHSKTHIVDTVGVRPALVVTDLNQNPGDTISLFGHNWTVLTPYLLLCNDTIGSTPFVDEWEGSHCKDIVENWLHNKIEECTSHITIFNKAELRLFQALCKKNNLNTFDDDVFDEINNYFKPFFFIYSPYTNLKYTYEIKSVNTIVPTTSFAEFCKKINKGEKL